MRTRGQGSLQEGAGTKEEGKKGTGIEERKIRWQKALGGSAPKINL